MAAIDLYRLHEVSCWDVPSVQAGRQGDGSIVSSRPASTGKVVASATPWGLRLIALVLVAVIVVPAFAEGPSPKSPPTPIPADLTATEWQTATTFRGYPLSNDARGHLTFIFPDILRRLFGYVHSKSAYRLAGFSTYQASFSVAVLSGSPVFASDAGPDNPCAQRANSLSGFLVPQRNSRTRAGW